MENDNRVVAFFTVDEIQGYFQAMMYKAQEELYKRIAYNNPQNPFLTKEKFFEEVSANESLSEVMRNTVRAAIQNVDWGECLNIAMLNTPEGENWKKVYPPDTDILQ